VCQKILSCNHQCAKMCHSKTPDSHGPCVVLVEKKLIDCGHVINFKCSETPTQANCTHQVRMVLPCYHINQLPCHVASSPEQLKKVKCTTPCKSMLKCEHECSGTCGTCRSGQLHIPCEQKCDRTIICSHVTFICYK
jgi:hypothetical protein